MLASASALAEHGERIKKVFANRDKPDNGFYILELFHLGETVYLTVDDRLPYKDFGFGTGSMSNGVNSAGSGVEPYNSKPSEAGAWWLPILEKGFAKFIQNYYQMNGGVERIALRAMTGMPVKRYKTEETDEDQIWELLSAGDANHYVMTASCYVDSSNQDYYSETNFDGLVTGHAYTVIGVNKNTDRIIIRNPWASELYHGEGSDQTDDGKFEMPVFAFRNSFPEFTILLYRDWLATSIGKQTLNSGASYNYKSFTI